MATRKRMMGECYLARYRDQGEIPAPGRSLEFRGILGSMARAPRSPKRARQDEPHPLAIHFPAAEAVAALLHSHAEVVVHDMATDRIVRIWNSFSSRKPGDTSYVVGDPDLTPDRSVYGPYERADRDGARIKSVTAALRDDAGGLAGLLCINLDMSKFDEAIQLLTAFVRPGPTATRVLFKQDLREQVNWIVREQLVRLGKRLEALERADRLIIIRELDRENVFETRNAAPVVARALGMSRASIYSMLREARAANSP